MCRLRYGPRRSERVASRRAPRPPRRVVPTQNNADTDRTRETWNLRKLLILESLTGRHLGGGQSSVISASRMTAASLPPNVEENTVMPAKLYSGGASFISLCIVPVRFVASRM